ncbi:PQQ-dependent sugar dehydrogenase [Bacillus suaedaesalsae]|uniref:PQQ-dependent sugar dehydrogenase n=1 Tax=Bacillus suaedaesalsae TaxID=2810349 RepID=UPI003211C0D9
MFIVALIGTIFLTGCSFWNQDGEIEVNEVFARQAEVIATDLEIPWNITKYEEAFYLSQRPGYIVKVDEATGEKTTQQLEVTKDIHHDGEGGLLGFLLAPNFRESREAFAYHTYQDNGQIFNRIILLKLNQNTWTEQRVILDKIPGGRIHNGGRIKVGQDGKLYATAGDAGNPDHAQNVNSLAGKILRMNLNGSIPTDNPFQGSYVYSYGHRNPQGLAWDEDGRLFSSEHGQAAHDEINVIEPGMNYGWPIIEGDQQAPNMKTPFYHTGNVTWAPSGIEIKDNLLYVATLRGESIKVLNIENKSVDMALENAGRLRDVLLVDEALYTITNNRDGRGNPREDDDQLLRLLLGR